MDASSMSLFIHCCKITVCSFCDFDRSVSNDDDGDVDDGVVGWDVKLRYIADVQRATSVAWVEISDVTWFLLLLLLLLFFLFIFW